MMEEYLIGRELAGESLFQLLEGMEQSNDAAWTLGLEERGLMGK